MGVMVGAMRDDQLPAPQPHACSVLSRELDEPLAGTGAEATAWLLVEQPGPWGRAAVTESRLDPALGAELEGRTAGTGVRLALIRRVEDHHDAAPRHRRWFAASTHPKRTWLASGVVEYPTDLLKIDFTALGAGDRRAVAALDAEFPGTPLLGVCTNGKRDACCATRGRQVAVAAEALDSAAVPGAERRVPGGMGDHAPGRTPVRADRCRAAVRVLLRPAGRGLGRLRLLADARQGRMAVANCRGRSTWPRAGQVAELAVRSALGEAAQTRWTWWR